MPNAALCLLLLAAISRIAFGTESIDELRKKAEAGDAEAQFQLGVRYDRGFDRRPDSLEAPRQFLKGVPSVSTPSPGRYSYDRTGRPAGTSPSFSPSDGVPKDPSAAEKWFRKAAEQGHELAQINLAALYFYGASGGRDESEAIKWYRKAAEKGNAHAAHQLGSVYLRGLDIPVNLEEAIRWLGISAEKGCVEDQLNLGLRYLFGEGVPKNITTALPWLRKAAEQGSIVAQRTLGWMYLSGEEVPKDSAEAAKWYRKAAEQRDIEAQVNLGYIYQRGDGVPRDSVESAKWFRRAAEQGSDRGQFNLGYIYATGDGVPRDTVEAVKWYRMAAEQGFDAAHNSLGVSYANGDGVPKDELEALAWFNLAAMSGDSDFRRNREVLEHRLGPQAALMAQQRSKDLLSLIERNKQKIRASASTNQDESASDAPNVAPKASGTGAIVTTSGHILTAAHVVAGAKSVSVITENGTNVAAVVRVDEPNDLAVLKIEANGIAALPVISSRGVKLGQPVSTIGFPNVSIQGSSPKLTRGEISSLNGIGDDPRSWQISVPVQPGNSGGPLLDANGNLIGVVESKLGLKAAKATGDLPQNVAYALKSVYALALLEPYLESGAPAPKGGNSSTQFEAMIAEAQRSVVLVLAY